MNEPLYRDSDMDLLRRLIQSKTIKLEDVGPIVEESQSRPLSDVLRSRGLLSGEPAPRLGKYEILERLGEGGMGVVYKARQTDLGRIVALKCVTGASKADLDRFRREATLTARLSHPNIAAIHEFGEAGGQPFLAMQFIDGKPLGGSPLPLRRALELIRDAAEAVHHAHLRGIVHRDLKPHNMMLDRDGRLYVLDFGLARTMQSEPGSTVTVSGEVLGTPHYMSPEQIQAQTHKIGPTSDVWSLGVTLYELITGSLPFESEKLADLIQAIVHASPTPPRDRLPSLDRDVETILLRCLEKDPAFRYSSAGELAADLSRVLRGEPIRSRRLGPVGKAIRSIRRNPAPAAAIALGILFTLPFILPSGRSAADSPHDPRIQFDDAIRQKDYKRAARYFLDLSNQKDERAALAEEILKHYKKEEAKARKELCESLIHLGAELAPKSRDHALVAWGMAVALDPENVTARENLGYHLPPGPAQDRLIAPSTDYARLEPEVDRARYHVELNTTQNETRLKPGRYTVTVKDRDAVAALYSIDLPAGAWARPKIVIPPEPCPPGFVFVSDGFGGGEFVSTRLVSEKEFSAYARRQQVAERGESDAPVRVTQAEADAYCRWAGGRVPPDSCYASIDGAWWDLKPGHVEWTADLPRRFSNEGWRPSETKESVLPFRVSRAPK